MFPQEVRLCLSGQRFGAVYRLAGKETAARAMAEAICIEQTVEFPKELLPRGDISSQVIGRIERFERVDEQSWDAEISYPVEVAGEDLTQLINVIFGNISILPGIRLKHLQFPDDFLEIFPGPRFGRKGLRQLLSIENRPILCTALKPMGLAPEDLAGLAYEFALSGIDIIKDDHGLANQPFSRWYERVKLCSEAVARANGKTGRRTIYMPNIVGTSLGFLDRAFQAKELGAGGLLIAPGLAGFDAVHQIAREKDLALPVMSHPSFLGSYVINPDQGIDHRVLLGQLMRLAGADAVVFPNYGGRFSFSQEECLRLVQGTEEEMGHLRSIFPAPGGGMTLERVPGMLKTYGKDVILLIGGGLFKDGSIKDNTRKFLEMLQLN